MDNEALSKLSPIQASVQLRRSMMIQAQNVTRRHPDGVTVDDEDPLLVRLELQNVKLLEQRVPIGDLKNMFEIYLYGIKQPDYRYSLYQDGTTLRVVFMDGIAREPEDILPISFDIEGKVEQL